MRKNLFIPIIILALLSTVIGCNKSSDDEEYQYVESSSVMVSAFSLSDNSKILDSLSNVFFTIDLVNAKIFNADSLPYGTKVTNLVPKITVASNASAIDLKFYSTKAQRDSTVNFITNSSDSIDFAGGPVMLTVTSQSGAVKRTYEVKVNVHKVKSDSLVWYSIEHAPLPTSFAAPKSQRTAMLDGTYYCLTSDGSAYSLATTTDPADPDWMMQDVAFDFVPDVESLHATGSALYMLSEGGDLYTSADFKTWSPTGQVWHHIYGAYGDEILGSAIDGPGYKICSYPSGKVTDMPASFPVSGTSEPAVYSMQMGYAPQLVMVGGILADGTFTNDAWGYDGSEWAAISVRPLPLQLADVTMVPYSLVELKSSTWAPVSYPVLMAFGGRNDKGAINRTVYYSRDWGMTWREAPDMVQLSDEIPTFYGASAFVHTTTMYPSRSAAWIPVPLRRLPPAYSYLGLTASRATAPITSWTCPAIYLFGGRNYAGETLNDVWRGVILEFTFEPVQ